MGWNTRALRLAVAVVLLWAPWLLPAHARTVLELDTARQPVHLSDWGDAWLDRTGEATVTQVADDPDIPWQPTADDAVHELSGGQALWVRFTIPPAPDAERWYLEIPYASLDSVTLYMLDSIGLWQPATAGDSIAVADWPIPHRHPLLPLAVSAEEPRKYIARIENGHDFGTPLTFISESQLIRSEQRTALVLGVYFGLAGLAVILGALSAVSLRDRAYGLYALSVGMLALSQAAITGVGGLHLWPRAPTWNGLAPMVLSVLALGAVVWFFSAASSIRERFPRVHGVMLAVALASLVVAVAMPWVEPGWRWRLMVPYVVVAISVSALATVWAALRGDRYAPWVLAATTPLILTSIFPLARTAGLIPVGFWAQHGMQVGMAIELPLMLMVLLMRSQQRREHQRRLQGLHRMDPATGLINPEVFAERMERTIARARRLNYRSAVLLVDLVNIEQVRRDFGARSAAELQLRVAGRLLATARDIDTVARLSDTRFGILVEGPLSEEQAASLGARVVARCLMPFAKKPADWVAQVRVAQAMVPEDAPDARYVITLLQERLARVAPDSRQAVFTLAT